VRSYIAGPLKRHAREAGDPRPGSIDFLRRQRSRIGTNPTGQGRWSLTRDRVTEQPSAAEWSAATAQQLLIRNGIVMREAAIADNVAGGYSNVYPALRAMEDKGLVRRGMFVAGLGAAQFAMPAAVDLLRSLRNRQDKLDCVHLAASDPANAYGSLLPWQDSHHSMARAAGATVVLVNGTLAAFLRKRNPSIKVFLPEDEPERTQFAQELTKKLAEVAVARQSRRYGMLIGEINEAPAREHFLAHFLEDAGFVDTAAGFMIRRAIRTLPMQEDEEQEEGA
jgi:ATP-dependent Lhr-like helicase